MMAEPPRDPHADPFGFGPWFVSKDGAIWTGAPRAGMVPSDSGSFWIRPEGTTLAISARRLDADAPPVTDRERAGQSAYGFYDGGISLPTEACWE